METQKESDAAVAVGCPSETSLAGRADVCKGCPGQSLCQQQGGSDPDQEMIDLRMNAIKHKILVLSGKGGVGKSSLACTLSMALAKLHPNRVGLVDVDICGPSCPQLMAVKAQTVVNTQWGWTPLKSPLGNVKVMSIGSLLQQTDSAVVWRGPRKTQLIKRFLKDTFWGRLDYLVFDTPPGTSDEHLTVVKALKNVNPEGAVIVTTSQLVAMATVRKEISFCRKMGLTILGVVENMSGFVCPCCQEETNLFPTGGVEALAEEFNLRYLGKIPLDPSLTSCCEAGQSILEEYPDSSATKALMGLAKTLEACLQR
ncbi:cytosolic Fe-S cluster assembly factor NUBP2 homolog [Patiria miniata]|uniref:Cytosolic Fe-S cluster assembly factor NUBP1 homolog n=1 Tax=Patiria miniata TaxID=46514 RepID=A0A913Z9Q1_PATMI|nr:cytosolic Fe-S cluster assembly factor NUBP2 homolog [Patiria miniata]